jgi:CBS domain containing-hemolysin-like protein
LSISATLSGYEVAFFNLGDERREALFSQHTDRLWAHWLKFFHQIPEKVLATVLIGNTFVNIGITLLILHLSETFAWPYQELLGSFTALTLIVFFGEIIPKAIALSIPELTLQFGTLLVQLLFLLTYPLVMLLERLRKRLEKTMPLSHSPEALLEVLENLPPEALPNIERHTLRNLILLRTLPVKSFMISRIDMKAIPIHFTWAEVKATFQKLPYIRIAVYGENLDDMRGVLYLKDLLPYWQNENLENWQGLLRPIHFVPETKKAYAVFMELRARRQHLAIVVDEYGSVAGVITLQRLLEIVFGYGEEDRSPDTGYDIQPDGSIIFQAQVPLVLVRRLLDLPDDFFDQPEARQAENLADFLLALTGQIPKKGEKIPYEDYMFEILEATDYRIDRVRAYRLLSKPDPTPSEGLS